MSRPSSRSWSPSNLVDAHRSGWPCDRRVCEETERGRVPDNNEMQLTRSAPVKNPRPSQLISVFDGPDEAVR